MIIDIKAQLEKSHISRYELAKRIGVTYPTIDKIYKGTTVSINFNVLEKLCLVLDCTPNEILIMSKPGNE